MTSALRGGGGLKNCLIWRTNSTDRLREMRMKGGRGSKNPKILWTSFKYGPKEDAGQWKCMTSDNPLDSDSWRKHTFDVKLQTTAPEDVEEDDAADGTPEENQDDDEDYAGVIPENPDNEVGSDRDGTAGNGEMPEEDTDDTNDIHGDNRVTDTDGDQSERRPADEPKPSVLSQGLEIAGITIGVTVTLVAVIVVAVYSRINEMK